MECGQVVHPRIDSNSLQSYTIFFGQQIQLLSVVKDGWCDVMTTRCGHIVRRIKHSDIVVSTSYQLHLGRLICSRTPPPSTPLSPRRKDRRTPAFRNHVTVRNGRTSFSSLPRYSPPTYCPQIFCCKINKKLLFVAFRKRRRLFLIDDDVRFFNFSTGPLLHFFGTLIFNVVCLSSSSQS